MSRAASVTDEVAMAAAADEMAAAFGGIDAVVNSAGVVVVEPALEARTDTFRKVLDVNLVGTWIVCQAAARHMARAGSGSIVNISSVYGFQGAPPTAPPIVRPRGAWSISPTHWRWNGARSASGSTAWRPPAPAPPWFRT
ncbi:SDR family NAD(P)-dependent oxidoreductase [Ancylobacter dichloromethanicus]